MLLGWVFTATLDGIHCTYYSTSSSLPAYIRTLTVPLFGDQTTEFGVKEQLTDAVIDGFVMDNHLKVINAPTADAAVVGTIVDIREEALTYDAQEQVTEFRLWLFVEVRFEDQKKDRTIWAEERMSGWGTFSPEEGREVGLTRAIGKLAEDIVNRTVADW